MFFFDEEPDCLTCKLLHCDYYRIEHGKNCPKLKEKKRHELKRLQNHVYFNLAMYGNGVIALPTFQRLGEETIIRDLEINGFSNVVLIKSENGITVQAKRKGMIR